MLNNETALNRVFQALADPTRRSIVTRLMREEATVSALAEPLNMSLAAVVQHIQVLEDSGVIRTQKQGRVRTCRVNPQVFDLVGNWISEQRNIWQRRLDLLDAVLKNPSHSKGNDT